MKQSFDVTGMTCAACSARVTKAASAVEGVDEVVVNLLKNSMEVEYNGDAAVVDAVCAAVDKAGYGAIPRTGGSGKAKAAGPAGPTPQELQQKDLQRRLNRAIGQLNGVKAMIDDNRYCGDVLTQLSAAESAVHSISAILLQNHLETCVVEQIERGNVEVIDEAMQLIKKFAR